ncbi:MAG: cytochrome d ubiquinol oxidase subunit II [Myxococcales bacterium]|nr:MAG: cytochrome d ubiquinol oxidase subunit II [Myxococcales bacterium]
MNWDLQTFWFILLGVLMAGYGILDGFDLGVGVVHLGARDDRERRLFLNAIGPLWDGNEVWLVTFGGALFAAFPVAYAAAFSGFYVPFMLLLFCLIFRAVSIEFRSKRPEPGWRRAWDVAFSVSSGTAALLFGAAVGNAMQGMAIDERGEYVGDTLSLFSPYPLLVGVFAVATCAMHGSIYLQIKTEGDLLARVQGWSWRLFAVFGVLYVVVSAVTLALFPHAYANFRTLPSAWVIVVLNVLAVANIPRALHQGRPLYALISSGATIAALTFLFGMALYPNLLDSSLGAQHNLTIYNAASSRSTLQIMRLIALIGMPFVLAYTGLVYWVFRGKVKLDDHSY